MADKGGQRLDWWKLTEGVSFHTARWANPTLKGAQKSHLIVGTSNGEPKWPLGYAHMSQKRLAPDYASMSKPYQEFRKAYRAKLHGMGDGLRKLFLDLAAEARVNGKSAVVLLCFEDIRETTLPTTAGGEPHGDWCHRQLLAEFMAEEWGLRITEMSDPSPLPSEKKSAKKKGKGASASTDSSPAEPEGAPKSGRLSKRERQAVELKARETLPEDLRAKVWNGDAKLKSDAAGQVFLQDSLFG